MATDLHAIRLSADAVEGARADGFFALTHAGGRAAVRLTDWRGFHSELQRAAIAATQTGAPLSLLMVEIAELHRDREPRGAGSAAEPIAAVPGVVEAAIGERALLARYSEGRLAAILTGTDLGEAIGRAERIAHRLASPHQAGAGGVDCRASAAIGVAQFQDDESLGHLIQRTAEALEQARSRGGLAVVVVADRGGKERLRRVGSGTTTAYRPDLPIMPSKAGAGGGGSAA